VKKIMKTTYGTLTKPMSQRERMPPKREIIAANIFLLQHAMLYYISQHHCSTAILLLIIPGSRIFFKFTAGLRKFTAGFSASRKSA
jgi:hypothetical protein